MASFLQRLLTAAALNALMAGPAAAAEDLAVVKKWIGKEPFVKIGGKSLWAEPAVQQAMRAAMGGQTFSRTKKTVFSGPQAPVVDNGAGVVVAWSCKAHDCGDNQIHAFFDTERGTAQICLRRSDRSGKVEDLWLANGTSRKLPHETCLIGSGDPFALLRTYGEKS
jgi:hypothetical protein